MVNVIIKDFGMVIKNVTKNMNDTFVEWLEFRNNKGVKTHYDEETQTLTVDDTKYFTDRDQAHEYWYKLI